MKILIISYGIYESDGRLHSLEQVFKNIGDTEVYATTFLTGNEMFSIDKNNYLNPKKLLSFYKEVMLKKNIKDFDVIVLDNYFVSPIGMILKNLYPNKVFIQDVRELYLFPDLQTLKSKVFIFSEYKMMMKSDIILVANKFRATIMKKIYHDIPSPIVFENVRFLPLALNNKNNYDQLIDKNKFNIISTGGLSVSRGILDILNGVIGVDDNFHMYIVGGATNNDIKVVNEFISDNSLEEKVTLIDKVPMYELKGLVSKCDVGIVNYHKKDLNNLYCSSGKIYEYLNEGLPIICTDNPPLKEFCETTDVGLSGSDFREMITEMYLNYSRYKKNVNSYIINISPQNYNKMISLQIEDSMRKKRNENK